MVVRLALLVVLLPPAALAQVCAADAECEAQKLCTAKPALELTCHRRCQLGCGAEERCTVLRAPDDERWPKARRRYVCTEETKRLCQPCEADADCDGYLDRCLFQVNGEKACGRDCSWDDQCPKGYRCADPGGVDGREVRRQCIPEAGCCACDQGFFVPAERPPELPAAGPARASGGAALPAPAPAPASAWPTTRPGAPPNGANRPGWRSPTAGAPSLVPGHNPATPRGSTRITGAGLPTPAPSGGVTPRPAPTSRHTGAGPLPAPSPSGSGSSTSSRPAPPPVGKSVVK